jgi:hypothetical protein
MTKLTTVAALVGLVLAGGNLAKALTTTGWLEYPSNPVYTDGSKAYYPTILKEAGDYAMWYAASDGIKITTSADGMSWSAPTSCTGLTSANHPLVK